jgi:hypothetical protein
MLRPCHFRLWRRRNHRKRCNHRHHDASPFQMPAEGTQRRSDRSERPAELTASPALAADRGDSVALVSVL